MGSVEPGVVAADGSGFVGSRRMQLITSRRNSLVTRCRELARRRTGDQLLLDGFHLVTEAFDANITIRSAVASRDALARTDVRELVDRLVRRGADVVMASQSVMDAISPVRSASDLVAIAERPALETARVYGDTTAMVVVVDNVQDPGNIGGIVRVAEAGGATGVVVAGASANPFGWKALRGSMGSAFRLPIVIERQLGSALEDARLHGCQILATVPRGGRSHFEIDLSGPLAIIVGGEGAGIPPGFIESADVRVTIPMKAPVESLNAAVAAAVLIYEARRQRSAK
jgi:TrmH family RNA methyltransferase